MEKDYHKILGVDKNSSDDEIKLAYKKLAMKYHPDKNQNNPDAEEKFKEIKEAYEILTNKNELNNDGYFNSENLSSKSNEALDNIFQILFNKYRKNNNKFSINIEIDLEQAFFGSEINFNIDYNGNCKKCLGKGYRIGADVKICNKCSGAGILLNTQGLFTFKQKCFKCSGLGFNSDAACFICKGTGILKKNIDCGIIVKSGSENNSVHLINFEEDEDITFNTAYSIINIKPHPLFESKDYKSNDIRCKYIVDFIKAILGGEIRVYTLHGTVIHNIKKSIQFNEVFKIKYHGLNFNKFKKLGDLYLEIIIEIPLKVSRYQKFLLRKIKLSIIENFKVYPLKSKFLNNLNNFYFYFNKN